MKRRRSVVVPAKSPIDKLIAYKSFELRHGDNYEIEVMFCDKNEPTPADIARFASKCDEGIEPYYIDVGQKKYHHHGPSASEVEAIPANTQDGIIWNQLKELANKNNKTGCLKSVRHSTAKLLRGAYDVMNAGAHSQGVVFDHGMDVVNAFFLTQNLRNWDALFVDPQYLDLSTLWKGFQVEEHEVSPFTLPLYFRQLFLNGRSTAEITEKISWWLDKAQRIEKRRAEAKLTQFNIKEFCVAYNLPAGFVHVNDIFEAEAFNYAFVGSGKLAVGFVKNPLGHIHIQPAVKSRGVLLENLFAELNRREPGRWYCEKRFSSAAAILMNGSNQYTGVTPTSLSDDEIISLAKRFVAFSK